MSSRGSDRYIWHQNDLNKLPGSAIELFRDPLTRPIVFRTALEAFSLGAQNEDMSIGEFVGSKFGAQGRVLSGAMVAGIFAGDIDQLSVNSCFPDLVRTHNLGHGSLVRGSLRNYLSSNVPPVSQDLKKFASASSLSFLQGMSQLSVALEASCKTQGVVLRTNSNVSKLQRDIRNDLWAVEVDGGTVEEFDVIVSSLRPSALNQVMPQTVRELDDLCSVIGDVDVVVVNLAFTKVASGFLPARGFGHLVAEPQVQHADGCLGVIYDSIAFPEQQPDNMQVVSVMLGGAHAAWVAELDEDALLELALSAVDRHLAPVRTQLVDSLVTVHKSCIPQYRKGHSAASISAHSSLASKKLYMIGNSLNGVGLADSIGSALQQADALYNQA